MDHGDWGEGARLYPEIVRVGGLAQALQSELDRAGSAHRAMPNDAGRWWLLLHPFVALAFRDPRLRALLPWTAMWTLGFSDPARRRLPPSVEPLRRAEDRHGKGLFVVRADRDEIGRADAAGSLGLVLSALPSITRPTS